MRLNPLGPTLRMAPPLGEKRMTGQLEGASAAAESGDFTHQKPRLEAVVASTAVTPPTALTRESLAEPMPPATRTSEPLSHFKPGIAAGTVIEPVISVPDPSSWMPQPEPPLRRPPIRPDFETTFVPPPLSQPPTWPPYGFHSQDDGEVPRMVAERQRRMVAVPGARHCPPTAAAATNK